MKKGERIFSRGIVYFINRGTVFELKIWNLILWFLLFLIIELIIIYNYEEIKWLNSLVATIIALVLGPISSFVISKKTIFDDEIIGLIFAGAKDDRQGLVERFSNMINSYLSRFGFILSNSKKQKLEELSLLMKSYKSCLPFDQNEISDYKSTIQKFEKLINKNKNIFSDYGISLNAIYYIYLNNLRYYEFYHALEVSELLSEIKIEIPTSMLLYHQFSVKTIDSIKDKRIQEIIAKFSEAEAELTKLETNDVNNYFTKSIANIEQLSKLFEELDSLEYSFKYRPILQILAILLYAKCQKIIASDKNTKKIDLRFGLNQSNLASIKRLINKFKKYPLIELLDIHRTLIAHNLVDFYQLVDILYFYKGPNHSLINGIISNYLFLLIANKEFQTFSKAYEILQPYFIDSKLKIDKNSVYNDVLIFNYLEIIYQLIGGSLSGHHLDNFRKAINKEDISTKDVKEVWESILYEFSLRINDINNINWIKENSSLSSNEIHSIENTIENRSILPILGHKAAMWKYVFPNGINKDEFGMIIFTTLN